MTTAIHNGKLMSRRWWTQAAGRDRHQGRPPRKPIVPVAFTA
jgi:hypothetical protein